MGTNQTAWALFGTRLRFRHWWYCILNYKIFFITLTQLKAQGCITFRAYLKLQTVNGVTLKLTIVCTTWIILVNAH